MGICKKYALAGLLAVATTSSVLAADLLPPAPMAPPPMPVAEAASGWYLRGDVGVGSLDYGSYTGTNLSPGTPNSGYIAQQKEIGDQIFVGAGIGYQFNNWVRFDATGEYRSAASWRILEQDTNFLPNAYDVTQGKISSIVGLANVYFDLGNWYGITPFVGAGVGVGHHMFNGVYDLGAGAYAGGIGFAQDHDKTNLAWALHAGLSYDVTPNLKLEMAYRYLNMGEAQTGVVNCAGGCPLTTYKLKDLESQDFKIGMRWMLGGPVMAAAPEPAYGGPIVRKY